MCGICGTLSFKPEAPIDRSVLTLMNEQIRHRGPDDEGYFARSEVGMAMRRLSIIDVATGQQPISNEDGSITIVFNGEIYNYAELRRELQSRGHRFTTNSDTETIVHAYEEFGEECVRHLRGMFAFAIWDEHRRVLFLARDRLGIKPLYVWLDDGKLAFASEIKALLAHPGIGAELDHSCLPEYLAFGYLTGSGTLFRGIRKVMPGHTLSVTPEGRVEEKEYWSLATIEPDGRYPKSHYVAGYRALLEECVRSHLMSEVPLGVFLSGGLDSSTIAALTQKMVDGPVETFSVGYDAPESELSYARAVADHLGTVHHEVRVGPREFFDSLPALIWHEDEPLAWPSSVSLHFVARLARQRVTVVLTGEGSDETLGGYTRYALSTWNARLDGVYRRITPATFRSWLRGAIAESGMLGDDVRRRLQHCFFGRDLGTWPDWYFEEFYVAINEAAQARLLHPDLRPEPGAPLRASLACWERSRGGPVERLLRTDINSYLIELLMKQDQMSMAASVESRVPFLDHELVEFALKIPSRYNVRGLSGKRILKEAVGDLLPPAIVHRRKEGFPTPLRAWLRGPELDRVERMLQSSEALQRGLFDSKGLGAMFAEHRGRQHDHTDAIWRLLNLEVWCRVFLDRAPVRELAPAAAVQGGTES